MRRALLILVIVAALSFTLLILLSRLGKLGRGENVNSTGRLQLLRNLLREGKRGAQLPSPSPAQPGGVTPASPSKPAAQPDSSGNPFGVMLGAKNTKAAKELEAKYYRPTSVFIDRWRGICAECDTAKSLGLVPVLTVRNNGGAMQPTTPVTDIEAYKNTLSEILDKHPTPLLVVENEENSGALFYGGTSQQYHQELLAGCQVAHSKNIKCTNGGLVSSLTALLTANRYYESGENAKAEDYLKRTIEAKLLATVKTTDPAKVFAVPEIQSQVAKGKELLGGYKAAGADYVNFHWYIADTGALDEAVAFLNQTTGLPVLTNEIGQQQNENPAQVTAVMGEIVKLKLPYAIWFSIDMNSLGGARALINPDGSLRPNGEAFKQFIQSNFR